MTHFLYRIQRIFRVVPYPEILKEPSHRYLVHERWFDDVPAGSEVYQQVDDICKHYPECCTYRDAVLGLGRELRVADANYIGDLAAVLARGDVPEPSDWPLAAQPN